MCEKMIKPVERIKLEMIIVKKWFYSTAPELLLDIAWLFFLFNGLRVENSYAVDD